MTEERSKNERSSNEEYAFPFITTNLTATQLVEQPHMNYEQSCFSQRAQVEYLAPAGPMSGLNTPTTTYHPSPGFNTKSFGEDVEPWAMASIVSHCPRSLDTSIGSNLVATTSGLGLFAPQPHSLLPLGPLQSQPQSSPFPPALEPYPPHSFEAIPGASNDIVGNFIKPSPTESRRFICTYCTEPFTARLDALRDHVREHLGITKLFQCLSCRKTFTTQRAARRHQQSQMKKWNCPICGQSFARLDYAKKHQRRCETRHGLTPQLETLNLATSP